MRATFFVQHLVLWKMDKIKNSYFSSAQFDLLSSDADGSALAAVAGESDGEHLFRALLRPVEALLENVHMNFYTPKFDDIPPARTCLVPSYQVQWEQRCFALPVMLLRIQIFFITIALATLTIIIGVGSGTVMMRSRLLRLEEDSLRVVADIADALVSSKLDFLKSVARTIALEVVHANDENVHMILQEHLDVKIGIHDEAAQFSALTIVEKTGEGDNEKFSIVASAGKYPLPEGELSHHTDYIRETFIDNFAVSTTVEMGKTADGEPELVFFVCAPIKHSPDDSVQRILCATLSGMYFTDLLNSFRIWDNEGDIVLCDGKGYVIACIFPKITARRTNFIHLAEMNSEFQSLADMFIPMTERKSGRSVHTLDGVERVGYYRPVTGSRMNWALAVTAPTVSSLHREAMRGILVIDLVCLVISCIVAYFASGFLVKPFKEANIAREFAEKASASKSHFLANMSHEMRTPLNAVIGLSELALSSDDAKGEVAVNLEKIYISGVTLLSIINDLLDISKIEAGKLDMIPVEYDLPSLINDTVALNSVRIGSKPIQFTIDVDANLPSRFLGDELRVKQMLNNLLSNAFKYTQEGEVKWSITGKHEGETYFVVFKVTDTGLGIRKEDMEVLFQEYHQLDSKANRKIEGTGLGLALVRKMAGSMGGSIMVESEYGKGSTFTLQIQQQPLTDDPIGKDVAYNLAHMRFSQSKLARNSRLIRLKLPYARVLVVDDVQTNLDVAKGMLMPYEMQVDGVTSGQEAVTAIRNEKVRYNAVFMDHMMPGMDGIETTRRIREIGTEYAMNLPIIALTANAIVGNEEKFLKSGFQAFLSKPIDIMRLDIEIRRWVRDRSQESALDVSQTSSSSAVRSGLQSSTPASWEIEGVDKAKALAQFNSERTFVAILESFAVNTPPLLDKIRTCTESQLPDYATLIHGIKGTCYSICADGVGKQAEELEHAAKQGNFRYVSEHNDPLIAAVETLINRIRITLQELKERE